MAEAVSGGMRMMWRRASRPRPPATERCAPAAAQRGDYRSVMDFLKYWSTLVHYLSYYELVNM